jgi:hypothetical protein
MPWFKGQLDFLHRSEDDISCGRPLTIIERPGSGKEESMSMKGCRQWFMIAVAIGTLSVGAAVADELKVENLPADPKGYRTHVEQIISKVDALIGKLKNQGPSPALQDLIQTRDNILREVPKVENAPDGAKWTSKEARESVDAMLRLLKQQYEKAAEA